MHNIKIKITKITIYHLPKNTHIKLSFLKTFLVNETMLVMTESEKWYHFDIIDYNVYYMII